MSNDADSIQNDGHLDDFYILYLMVVVDVFWKPSRKP